MPKNTPLIVKTKSGKFRVKYYAGNGKLLSVSEELNNKDNAKRNIKAMRKIWVTEIKTNRGPLYGVKD